jgi:hypothetical protein
VSSGPNTGRSEKYVTAKRDLLLEAAKEYTRGRISVAEFLEAHRALAFAEQTLGVEARGEVVRT